MSDGGRGRVARSEWNGLASRDIGLRSKAERVRERTNGNGLSSHDIDVSPKGMAAVRISKCENHLKMWAERSAGRSIAWLGVGVGSTHTGRSNSGLKNLLARAAKMSGVKPIRTA